LQDLVPARKRKTKYEDRHELAVVIRRGDRVVLRRCGPQERWSGLWDFPRFPATARRGDPVRGLAQAAAELTGLTISPGKRLTTLKHGVTRFRITLDCYEAEYSGGRIGQGGDVRWVKISDLETYPLSVTGRKISQLLGRKARTVD
jgi:A/G-specific adenine glycosylase